MSAASNANSILTGSVVPVFFKFAIPSIFGLLAITTAVIVDGVFVGNYVGSEALASINLLIPYLTLLYGLVLMLSIGGAVRVGFSKGKGDSSSANEIYTLTMIAIGVVTLLNLLFIALGGHWLLAILGAPEALHEMMMSYISIVSFALVLQLVGMGFYYFARTDGFALLATAAISFGALGNILFNTLFVVMLGWGIEGAAYATLIAQMIQISITSRYFFSPKRQLRFQSFPRNWKPLLAIMYNGVSEFINEFSGGLVILVLNWLMLAKMGVEGVAAFAIVNYLIFLSLMLYYGVADAIHLIISQNYGAAQWSRIRQFMKVAFGFVASISVTLVLVILFAHEQLVGIFLDEQSPEVVALSGGFMQAVWPLFLVNGINVVISVYLTAIHRPMESLIVALSRSLVLPVSLMVAINVFWPQQLFLIALPISEWLTFVLALYLFVVATRRQKSEVAA